MCLVSRRYGSYLGRRPKQPPSFRLDCVHTRALGSSSASPAPAAAAAAAPAAAAWEQCAFISGKNKLLPSVVGVRSGHGFPFLFRFVSDSAPKRRCGSFSTDCSSDPSQTLWPVEPDRIRVLRPVKQIKTENKSIQE